LYAQEDGPLYLTPEQHLLLQTNQRMPKKKKTAKQLRADLPKMGKATDRVNRRLSDLQVLAEWNGVSAHPENKERAKTIAELTREVTNFGQELDGRRIYRLAEFQKTAENEGIPLEKTTKNAEEECWPGKPKGLLQVLRERGFIDTSKLNKYTIEGKKDK
jgi:hypothetical protein